MIDKYRQFGRGVSLANPKNKFKNSELTLEHSYKTDGYIIYGSSISFKQLKIVRYGPTHESYVYKKFHFIV